MTTFKSKLISNFSAFVARAEKSWKNQDFEGARKNLKAADKYLAEIGQYENKVLADYMKLYDTINEAANAEVNDALKSIETSMSNSAEADDLGTDKRGTTSAEVLQWEDAFEDASGANAEHEVFDQGKDQRDSESVGQIEDASGANAEHEVFDQGKDQSVNLVDSEDAAQIVSDATDFVIMVQKLPEGEQWSGFVSEIQKYLQPCNLYSFKKSILTEQESKNIYNLLTMKSYFEFFHTLASINKDEATLQSPMFEYSNVVQSMEILIADLEQLESYGSFGIKMSLDRIKTILDVKVQNNPLITMFINNSRELLNDINTEYLKQCNEAPTEQLKDALHCEEHTSGLFAAELIEIFTAN